MQLRAAHARQQAANALANDDVIVDQQYLHCSVASCGFVSAVGRMGAARRKARRHDDTGAVGAVGDVEAAAERRDALLHADDAEASGTPSGLSPPPSSVTRMSIDQSAFAFTSMLIERRLAVPHGVAQALLNDAIDGAVDQLAEALLRHVDAEVQVGPVRAPEGDEIVDGVGQPDVEQHRRAQASEDVAHMPLHAADGIADDADAVRDGFVFARLGELLDGHGIDVGGKQQGPDLIVQIAREVGALLVLHGRELLLQALVLRLRARQALDHLVEALIEAAPARAARAPARARDSRRRRRARTPRSGFAADEWCWPASSR